MAEKNPYDDLFSFKEDDATALAAKARIAPADQKARDTDSAVGCSPQHAKSHQR